MPVENLSITYVYDFHADDMPIKYNVMFGVALLRCAAPQKLECACEVIVVFPSLESAINPLFEGIRLMVVAERVASDALVHNLKASGFRVDDNNSVVPKNKHLYSYSTTCTDSTNTRTR